MIAAGVVLVLLGACGRGRPESSRAGDSVGVRSGDSSYTLPPKPYTLSVVFLGTSLTAGLGLDPDQAYPAVIQRKLDSLRLPWRAVNAGVSGETSAGALRRLDWVLRDAPAILVVETGANDMLRGEDLDSTRANLEAIVRRIRAADSGVTIVLVGMEAAPNLGPRYAAQFRALYRDVAAREHLPLIPFLLQGVGGVDSLNQADGIHPTAAGARIVAENVWRVLGPLVTTGTGARGHGRTGSQGQLRPGARGHRGAGEPQ
jgi:acyl-CoA thioesterase I